MTLIVSPNLSLDQTVAVARLTVGGIHRVPTVVKLAGGKGANVARALRALGGDPLLCGFVGGQLGALVAAYLRAEGIAHRLTPTQGETRICFTIADDETGTQTEFYEGGSSVTADEVGALLADAEACLADERSALSGASWVAITGSLPPGAPADLYARLITLAHAHGARTLLDAKGAALVAGLAAGPDLVKINRVELADMLGEPMLASPDDTTPLQVADAAARAVRLATSAAVITLGEAGAVVVSAQGRWLVTAPAVQARSPVGGGDCVAAGLLFALERGQSLTEATRLGMATGAANARHLGASRITRLEVDTLVPQAHAQEIIP